MTKRTAATLVWMREEDDQLRASRVRRYSHRKPPQRLRKKSGLLRRLVDGLKAKK